jgi:hypothetical protein
MTKRSLVGSVANGDADCIHTTITRALRTLHAEQRLRVILSSMVQEIQEPSPCPGAGKVAQNVKLLYQVTWPDAHRLQPTASAHRANDGRSTAPRWLFVFRRPLDQRRGDGFERDAALGGAEDVGGAGHAPHDGALAVLGDGAAAVAS